MSATAVTTLGGMAARKGMERREERGMGGNIAKFRRFPRLAPGFQRLLPAIPNSVFSALHSYSTSSP
jgi:hypothetical protein